MKLRNFWMLGVLCGGLLSCSDEMVFQEEEKVLSEAPFTIYASNGVDTRLQYGEDGLTLQWNDQDQLLLIDVTGKLKPIPLTTTLEAPSAKAVFRSEAGVPAGTYFVRNVGRMNNPSSSLSGSELMTFGNNPFNDEYCLYRGYLQERSKLQQDIDLYAAEPITVKEGQVSVDVELKHAYAMIKVNIINADDRWSSNGVKNIGMLCPTKAFPMQSRMDEEGTITDLLECPRLPLTREHGSIRIRETPENILANYAALVLPVDLSQQDVYFYVSDLSDSYGNEHEKVYEIVKKGINLKAGMCYTVTLDLSQATEIEIINRELSTPKHFRALAYNSISRSDVYYTVTDDINFEGSTYFPIIFSEFSKTVKIDGGNHTLSNLKIEWPFKGAGLFGAGLAHEGVVQNLNMESVEITGTECVGAFCGTLSYSLKNCHLKGKNVITGAGDMVGGLMGGSNSVYDGSPSFEACTVSEETEVNGKNYVGGLAGGLGSFHKCSSKAIVTGVNNVGGITGLINGTISESSSTAQIDAGGDNVGGVAGGATTLDLVYYAAGSITKSSFSGSLSGKNRVGGIIGSGGRDNGVTLCYSVGTVNGTAYVGGISGQGCNIKNCYSLSKVTGTDEANKAGGIVGEIRGNGICENCYFAGTVSGGYGIAGVVMLNSGGGYFSIKTCITTAENLSLSDSDADKAYTNLESIQDNVGFINADQVYATENENMWPDVANHCPKFLWQITGGENSETTSPPFTDGGEW